VGQRERDGATTDEDGRDADDEAVEFRVFGGGNVWTRWKVDLTSENEFAGGEESQRVQL
jgi:hypothetical protein